MPLTPKQQRVVIGQLGSLARSAKKADFSPGKRAQQESENIKNALLDQKGYHRQELLRFITRMTVASFGLLAMIVLLQMSVRLWRPHYVGASDAIIKTLTVGVFGQIIGVVASIVVAVWRDTS